MNKEVIIQMVMYVAVFGGIFYVFLILPQKRREKKTNEMRNSISTGDDVVTIGGISGKVVNIKDEDVTIESGIEKTKVKLKKWAISKVEKPITDQD